MRPVFALIDAYVSNPVICTTTLIAGHQLGYHQPSAPVGQRLDRCDWNPNAGEAEMESKRPKSISSESSSNESASKPEPETRQQRLARIRAEIDAGTYETPEKLEIAIDRMLGIIAD